MRLPCLTVVALVLCVGDADLLAQDDGQNTDPRVAAEQSDHGLVRRLFTTLGNDLKRLPSKDNATILLNGGIIAIAVSPFDEMGTHGFSSSTILKAGFAGFGKALGREWVQGGGALAAYAVGRVLHRPRLTDVAGDLIEAQLLSATITHGLKFAVSRERPDREARSFPSGHASAAFATASTLQRHFGRWAAIPAYTLALYTSASRLQANSHYASDVIFGAALGIVSGRTATVDVRRTRLQMAPAPTEGGFAIVFTTARE